ncbi:unnamed protein product [Sphagnum balticum]
MGVLAHYMAAPTIAHWEAALGIVRYLVKTANYDLTFGGSSETLDKLSTIKLDMQYEVQKYLITKHGAYPFILILSDEIDLPFQNVLDYNYDIERMIAARGCAVSCLWLYVPENNGCSAMVGIL